MLLKSVKIYLPSLAAAIFVGAFGFFLMLADMHKATTASWSGIQQIKDFQGLVLDSGGQPQLLISMIEKNYPYKVQFARFSKGEKTLFEETFSNSPSLSIRSQNNDLYLEVGVSPKIEALLAYVIIPFIVGFLIIFVIKQALQKRNKLQTELTIAKLSAEIAHQVAHDLRAPVGALKTITASLPHEHSSTKALADQVIERIQNIANDLLKKYSSTPTPKTIKTIIEQVSIETQLLPENKTKQLHWVVLTTAQSDPNIKDYAQLTRILSNILKNALDVSPIGGKICLLTTIVNSNLQITISDEGPGFPIELINKIGTKPITHNKPNGNGLGLYHAINTLKSWGGSLTIQSEQNQGTTVTLTIPVPSLTSKS